MDQRYQWFAGNRRRRHHLRRHHRFRRSPFYALTDGGQGTVTMKWSFKAGEDIESSAAIGADGMIYFGSNDKNLYALESRRLTQMDVRYRQFRLCLTRHWR